MLSRIGAKVYAFRGWPGICLPEEWNRTNTMLKDAGVITTDLDYLTLAYNSTTDDVDLNGPLWTDNSYRKLSAAIGQSSAGFADSGSLIGTDTVYQLPSASDALDSLYLGKAFGGGLSKYNVHIKRFAYFPTRKTDQELVKITDG